MVRKLAFFVLLLLGAGFVFLAGTVVVAATRRPPRPNVSLVLLNVARRPGLPQTATACVTNLSRVDVNVLVSYSEIDDEKSLGWLAQGINRRLKPGESLTFTRAGPRTPEVSQVLNDLVYRVKIKPEPPWRLGISIRPHLVLREIGDSVINRLNEKGVHVFHRTDGCAFLVFTPWINDVAVTNTLATNSLASTGGW